MKFIWHICRALLGLVFIFSGFVKGIDPLGSSYKFTDYFHAWGVDALVPLAFPLGILLAALEFAIGLGLLFNVFMRVTSILALLFMSFFTGLTFYIALKNPVTDCGCFGDALVLTNWQTFYKNILFLAFAVVVVVFRKQFGPSRLGLIPAILAGTTLLVYAYLVDYSYKHLPIIDFRPYKIGANIQEGMQIPEGAQQDVYQNRMVYENLKNGEQQEFTEDNYPWQDTLNWKFVSMESKLVTKGYEPPIHNFSMETPDGEDVKDFFLYDDTYTFVLVSTQLDKANWKTLPQIQALISYAAEHNMYFVGMTASVLDEAAAVTAEKGLSMDFFNCDEITLKTMIRSNPGLILLKKGTVLDKWHYNDIPLVEDFEKQRAYFKQVGVE
ncbi:MAG: BT_3928 family protein [Mangrovibacterium sp.]